MGMDLYIHIFLTSALVAGEWSTSRYGRFTPGERAPGTHWIGGWVDLWAGLDDVWPYRDSNSDPSVVQPIASRYTDYAFPAPAPVRNSKKVGKERKFCWKSTYSIYFILNFDVPSLAYIWLYSPRGPWTLFKFLNLYTVGRTPWKGNQAVARRYVDTEQHKYRINANRHPYF
jgi:hypothetical protein